jgi:diaminohydroxyphosphoribosylaminopyrimidine deaminase / 5-amino-6-(5-phosphoribosylamino)uracil reductase
MDAERWMKRVLRLAARGKGKTSPNPMVGALVVKEGRVVGEGYHRKAGEAHAEIVALRKAGTDARGATLYINLEPCCHVGKTPPCAPAVIEAGVTEVIVGMEDPNPRVSGRGIEALRQAGLKVRVGILEKDCRRLNEAFCRYIVSKMPFVILKVASTLDGKVATRYGESKWITNESSRHQVHRLRSEVDGVLVGIGTVMKDNPQLTSRIKGGRDPFRIILDSHLRIPEDAKVVTPSSSRTILATTVEAPQERVEYWRSRGVQVLVFDSISGRVPLRSCLSKLGEIGMMSLLVEGGSQISGSFLDEEWVDKLLLFLAPKLMGDEQAIGIFGGVGKRSMEEILPVREMRIKILNGDILIEGYLGKKTEPCSLES